jgi:hypothetical protein
MKLTVHIGTTKTGSTSIQAFFRANRLALAEQGILYPAVLGQQHHLKATVSSLNFSQSSDLMKHQAVHSEEELEGFRKKTSTAFRRALRGEPDHVVISSEHLQSRCILPENVQRFQSLFATGFDQVRVVIYVRPQLDQLISLYSTTLRNGSANTLEDHISIYSKRFFYFDLKGIIELWGSVFSKEQIIVRPFKALSKQVDGGVVADFCNLFGISHKDERFSQPETVNSSINVHGQELLRILNRNGGVDTERRMAVVRWIEENCSGGGAEPDLAAAKAFQDQFRDGNAWVIKNYFPENPEYLEPRWPKA